MKRRFKIKVRYIILLLLLLIPNISLLFWGLQEHKVMNVIIVDKTVSMDERNEHISFNWVLNYFFFKNKIERYKPRVHYQGFFPLDDKQFEIKDNDILRDDQFKQMCDTTDMVYFTDTYGVYYNEWYKDTLQTEHSPLVYGGLSEADYKLAKHCVDHRKLLIAEFNFFANPTVNPVRSQAENLIGMKWSGWAGRYFHTLDTAKNDEIPQWAVNMYVRQYHKPWVFKKPGILFVHESEVIVILEKDTALIDEVPRILTDGYGQKKYGLPATIHYPYWFDITFSNDTNRVVSTYKIGVNRRGKEMLGSFGIPTEFPAVTENLKKKFYYFSGDFADNPIKMPTSYFKGSPFISGMFYDEQNLNDRTMFFWTFYRPLMSEIVTDYYKNSIDIKRK